MSRSAPTGASRSDTAAGRPGLGFAAAAAACFAAAGGLLWWQQGSAVFATLVDGVLAWCM